MDRVIITGASGLLGGELVSLFKASNQKYHMLSRKKTDKINSVYNWDIKNKYIDTEVFEHATMIVHLAGESIASHRWTAKQWLEIENSRIESLNLLYEHIKLKNDSIKLLVSASAVGYYGRGINNKPYIETDKVGQDELAQLVERWEAAVDRFTQLGISVVKLRMGVVFSTKSGAFPKIIKPIKLGIASAIGSGKQWIPWVDSVDAARAIEFVVNNRSQFANEVFNVVAPVPIQNKQLTQMLSTHLRYPIPFFKVPSFVFRLIFGEMSQVILEGSSVSSQKIINLGFKFEIQDFNQFILRRLRKT